MNKTLKTVLITVAVIFVILFAAVMIFGEDTSTSNSPASNLQNGASATSNQEPSQDSPGTEVTVEMISKIINYDVFDWNGADEQGKIKIAKEIINFWAAKGSSYELTAEDLVAGIEQELQQDSEQANVFEKACIVAQIDPQAFFESSK